MVTKRFNTHYIYDKTGTRVVSRWPNGCGLAAEAEQHTITEAAPNERKLGEREYIDESWPLARQWRRRVLVRRRLRSQYRRFGVFWVQADTHSFRIRIRWGCLKKLSF